MSGRRPTTVGARGHPAPGTGRRDRVVVVGNAVVDVVLRVPAVPAPGADVLASSGALVAGGAVNVAAAAARQGTRTLYAGAHGSGPLGDVVRSALAAEGVDLALARSPADTGFDVAITDDDGERTFLTHHGAEASLRAGDLDAVVPGEGDVVVVSGYLLAHPGPAAMLTGWLTGLDARATVLVDPGPLLATRGTAGGRRSALDPAGLEAALARADVVTLNAAEAAALERGGLAGPVRSLLVRDGARGATWYRAGTALEASAPPVEVVDTNGAGDTHAGVLAAALATGTEPAAALERATVAASVSVTRHGPGGAPGRAELDVAVARARGHPR